MQTFRNGLRIAFAVGFLAVAASFAAAQPASASTCKVYALADLGDDPALASWVADAIPQLIEPASWKADGIGKVSYYAPARLLVIHHVPAVHAKIADFLDGVKKASQPQIVQAHASVPSAKTAATPTSPKHLFHFIIRYEGAGAVDSNLVKHAKNGGRWLNVYSSDPMIRMEQLMIDSENLRQMHDEWRKYRMNDQPSHLTPYRIHGGVGPASSSLYGPPLPPAVAK